MNESVRFTKGGDFYFSPDVWEFSLPAGHACPGALMCKAKADRKTGEITKGKEMIFPCYAATVERFPNVRDLRWKNFDTLSGKTRAEMFDILANSFPDYSNPIKLVRIHGSGDFFNQDYFDAWLDFCASKPDVQFWAFTKSLPYWVSRLDRIPDNFALTASRGGRHDRLITEYNLRYAEVFETRLSAERSGLPVDEDDLIPSTQGPSFALILRTEVNTVFDPDQLTFDILLV